MRKIITRKTKRRLTFISGVIFLLVGVIITTVFNDLSQIISNRNEVAVLSEKYNSLLKEEESLNSEITKLQDSDYVARYAREKYGYSYPNELIIKLLEDKS